MKVPVFRQEQPHTCLPACIRMVLAYWGRTYTEAELVEACNCVPVWGTLPMNAVTGVESLGYRALWFENASLERLIALLDHEWPVIVFVRATDLPHGRAGLHAVVVSGFESGDVLCVDPALGGEVRFDLNRFLNAWSALGHQGMVVWVS